jgi:hypothetical protein
MNQLSNINFKKRTIFQYNFFKLKNISNVKINRLFKCKELKNKNHQTDHLEVSLLVIFKNFWKIKNHVESVFVVS